ncbi:PaaI family thioesterase [Chitinivorax sp. B]|uniref:PaaI family thioesterase n=1 Tax=Chitinivorax sp. B TaxID=2502235 RepID=UPI0010F99F23|nr:PaaI family thioesterase [Chitinivorax sp. B]
MKSLPIPDGFEPFIGASPFVRHLGEVFVSYEGDCRVLAVRIAPHHHNMHGVAHGGMLLTLADTALGINLSTSQEPPVSVVTANLSAEFLEPARPLDWVEAHVEILRTGKRLAFAEVRLSTAGRLLLRASATFAVVASIRPEPSDG